MYHRRVVASRDPDLDRLALDFGIIFPPDVIGAFDERMHNYDLAMMATDAQPPLVTQSNAGIPWYLTNYIDPKFVEVLTAPNKAATVLNREGDVKKGDWTTFTATFPIVEHVGEIESYGDWNEGGSTAANANFPQRQNYYFQTHSLWGERQLEIWGKARIDYAQRLNVAAALVLEKGLNNIYLFGVGGLQNYGLLNHPGLPAPSTPATKAYGGVLWISNGTIVATANEVLADIQAMFYRLTQTSAGLINASTKLVLALSPSAAVALNATNSFGLNVYDLLKKNFPNIRIETVPQYTTAAGELVQLFAEEINGQETGFAAFSEKMRAHKIEVHSTNFKQKKSAGAWGVLIYNLFGFAQLIGV